jgi:hypothetical protein
MLIDKIQFLNMIGYVKIIKIEIVSERVIVAANMHRHNELVESGVLLSSQVKQCEVRFICAVGWQT